MCQTPYLILNPHYKLNEVSKNGKYVSNNSNLYLKNITDRYIPVPCGHCPDCVHLRQQYFIQRTIGESLDNDLFFVTLTYNRECLPHINVNGYNIAYANIKHIQDMLKRIRKNYNLPSFRYMCVSEFGKTTNRPHFHMLLSFPKIGRDNELYLKESFAIHLHSIFLKEWAINIGTRKHPVYKPLCTYKCTSRGRNFDLHYVNPSLSDGGISDVGFYVSKYMLKTNKYVDALKSALFYNTPDTDTFTELWSIVRPRLLLSKGYGNPTSPNVAELIRKGIDFAIANDIEYPVFCNPITPSTSPLSPYYRKKFATILDSWNFYFRSDSPYIDSSFLSEDYDPVDLIKRQSQFNKVSSLVNSRDSYCDDGDLDYDNDFIKFTSDYIDVKIQYDKLNINDLQNES